MKRQEAENFMKELEALLTKYNYELGHYDSLCISDYKDNDDYKKGYIDASFDRKERKFTGTNYVFMDEEEDEDKKEEK